MLNIIYIFINEMKMNLTIPNKSFLKMHFEYRSSTFDAVFPDTFSFLFEFRLFEFHRKILQKFNEIYLNFKRNILSIINSKNVWAFEN